MEPLANYVHLALFFNLTRAMNYTHSKWGVDNGKGFRLMKDKRDLPLKLIRSLISRMGHCLHRLYSLRLQPRSRNLS